MKKTKAPKTPKTNKTINCHSIDDIYAILYEILLKAQKRTVSGDMDKPLSLKKLKKAVYSYLDNQLSWNNEDEREHLGLLLFNDMVKELETEIIEYQENIVILVDGVNGPTGEVWDLRDNRDTRDTRDTRDA